MAKGFMTASSSTSPTRTTTTSTQHHRKIELQTPDDFRYLVDNVRRAAYEKLDLNFPPSAAVIGEATPEAGPRSIKDNATGHGKQEDALRRRVEDLVLDVRSLPLSFLLSDPTSSTSSRRSRTRTPTSPSTGSTRPLPC